MKRLETGARMRRQALFVHPDVVDDSSFGSEVRKRLTMVLQQLLAHGRTSIVKSSADPENRGWLRSPLGGNGGMQYYLWWAPPEGEKTPEDARGTAAIFARTVRTHDDHRLLKQGGFEEYLSFGAAELDDATMVSAPWTVPQQAFAASMAPVRVLSGQPGSGKTSALWRAVESDPSRRVLYSSWSPQLCDLARERFAAFARPDVRVDCLDFRTLAGLLARTSVGQSGLFTSRKRFFEALGRGRIGALGVWENREQALHAEARAYLAGRWFEGLPDLAALPGAVLLPADYVASRGVADAVGPSAAAALCSLRERCPDAFGRAVFPELDAARDAIRLLRTQDLPARVADVELLVIDEVQDLTLLELTAVFELRSALAARSGRTPGLLIAGDEGQTIRPTGFRWATASALVSHYGGALTRFALDSNERFPKLIADAVGKTGRLYAEVEKGRRPSRQQRMWDALESAAIVMHLPFRSPEEAAEGLELATQADDTILVAAGDSIPAWLPDRFRDAVLLPEDVKGLECRRVVVLNASAVLAELASTDGPEDSLASELRRTAVDRFRVASSRATETLVFLDVALDEAEAALTGTFFDLPASLFDDFRAALSGEFVPPDERVLNRLRLARELVDERPDAAVHHLCAALSVPADTISVAVRNQAPPLLLRATAGLAMRGPREEFASVWTEVSPHFDQVGLGTVRMFEDWQWKGRALSIELADAAAGKGGRGEWLRTVLTPVRERLFEAVLEESMRTGTASEFARGCGRLFAALGWTGAELEVRTGRVIRAAAETLLEAGQPAQCHQVLEAARLLNSDAENGLAELRARIFIWAAICNHGPVGQSAPRATAARDALKHTATLEGLEAFELLLSWAKRSGASATGSPVSALEAVLKAGVDRRLFAEALHGRSRELSDALRVAAGRLPDARRFDGPVEEWLALFGGARETAEDLRGRAFAVLQREREPEVAARVAALMTNPPPPVEPPKQPSVARVGGSGAVQEQDSSTGREVNPMISMIQVEAGSFLMGSPASEAGRDDDEILHEVQLTRSFELSKFPVTNALFRSVMGRGDALSELQGPTAPVVSVSWYTAVAFCNRLSDLHGYVPAYRIEGKRVDCDFRSPGFRLPTEAEWEYACRAGTTGPRYGELDRVAWYAGSVRGLPFPVAVGTKAPNAWGFHDMLGNVWEWAWDWYGPMSNAKAVDPTGPTRGTSRVWRGGAVAEQPRKVRAAFRSGPPPDMEAHILGFRVARTGG